MHMMYVLFAGYEALVGPEMKVCLDKVKIVKSKLDQATRLENEESIRHNDRNTIYFVF